MSLEGDHEHSPSGFYPSGLVLWARIAGWAFVIVPWLVLVVFHPVQDARMFWKVMTRPAEAGTTIAGWLGESYGHVLPILPWPQAQPPSQPNTASPEAQGAHPSGTLRRLPHGMPGKPIRCRPIGTRC